METERSSEVGAREINSRVREIAESFAERIGGEDSHAYTFFCECGCMQPITLTLAALAAASGVVLAEGHAAE